MDNSNSECSIQPQRPPVTRFVIISRVLAIGLLIFPVLIDSYIIFNRYFDYLQRGNSSLDPVASVGFLLAIPILIVHGFFLYHAFYRFQGGLFVVLFLIASAVFYTFLIDIAIHKWNRELDSGSAQSRIVEVLDKKHYEYYVGNRYNKRSEYNVVVKSWRKDRESEWIVILPREYDKIVPGESKVKVDTKPGYLGFEWVVSYKILSNE